MITCGTEIQVSFAYCETRGTALLIAMIAVVVCVALATFFVGDIPVAATDAAVSDESQSRGYKSGSTKEPSGIVDSIRAWRSKFLKELTAYSC